MVTGQGFEANVFASACPSREALQHLTSRWGALTVVALLRSPAALRFGEVRRHIEGISDRMLSQTLSQLERDGMVNRTVHSAIPPHVEYSLTPLGREIAEPLEALTRVIESEVAEIVAARESFDQHEIPAP